jgi:Polysaccharide deacetylase
VIPLRHAAVLLPLGKAIVRLLLNWGVLISLLVAVLIVRGRAEAEARAPLPPPRVHLSAAQERQWRAFPSYTRVVPVLVYHGINASNDSLAVTRRLFSEQMLALKIGGFHPITLAQYVNLVHGDRRDLPAKPILLTFDDGRLDAYRAANDILRNYGFHATICTFASWPVTNPGFSLTWDELKSVEASGIWSVQEHGGDGHEYVVYDREGGKGGVYAFLRYIGSDSGHSGHLEDFSSFKRRVTSNILWGERQFAAHLPGYRPLAFTVPEGNYGQQQTNDQHIPQFMLPWLKQHFAVVFGGDYLSQGHNRRYEISGRFSPALSYRITMGPRISLPALYCRLKDWVSRTPMWMEYRCMRLSPDIEGLHPGWEERHEQDTPMPAGGVRRAVPEDDTSG